ncbi:MAG: carboxypeptidase regulatory-like domain-containing protein [Gemmatimonas sp.]|nr:carboxypeptidase regulatory-like domain-containing protein [Gemmatimonadaceae bacterium]
MHRVVRLPSLIAMLFAAHAFAPVLSAQVRRVPAGPPARALGTIDGIVSDTSLAPLQAAFVSILGTKIRVGTGPNGRFRITKLPVGQYLVIVKRVGYRPASSVIDVPDSDTLRVAYALEKVNSTTLETVVVTEKAPSMRMAEFEARRKLGMGEFMTADEIAQRNSVFPTELFRKFLSVNVSPSRTTSITQYFALSRREGGNPTVGACPMQVYLDQVPLPNPFNLDLLPSPKDLAGIEVYPGSATIPPQFNGFDRGCGVILVWTKDGG